jgi:predicted transcriptional regulator
MKVLVIYRPNSDHARTVEEFVREFGRLYADHKLELVNIDSRDGISTATLYDVMQYPAVLALANDGQVLKDWQGQSLPLVSEIAYYAS